MRISSPARRLLLACGLAAAVLGGLPGVASAGVARITENEPTFAASAGEANRVTVTRVNASTQTVEDLGAPVTPGEGCRSLSANKVRCAAAGDDAIALVRLGDGDDTATLSGRGLGGTLEGDRGNDRLTAGPGAEAALHGGTGDDVLTGDDLSDELLGESGNDRLLGAGGDDELDGGPGADAISGGSGVDDLDYTLGLENGNDRAERPKGPVVVTLDGRGNDGAPGENDAIADDVENVQGFTGADMVTGNNGPNSLTLGGLGSEHGGVLSGAGGADVLFGGTGADTVDGGGGNDRVDDGDLNGARSVLRGGPGADYLIAADAAEEDSVTEEYELYPTADVISCGPGPDQVVVDTADPRPADCEVVTLREETRATTTGTSRSELIRGTGGAGEGDDDGIKALGGADRVTGLSGEDRIDGGAGRDVLDGGAGRDVLLARDGTVDTIRCGTGSDTVIADRGDRVARDCERVRRR